MRVPLVIRIFPREQGSTARKTAVYMRIHEDLSTELTQHSWKKTINRGARA